MTRRTERVNELLLRELSQLILYHLRDPRVGGLVTVTEVDTSPDLRHASVHVSVMGEAQQQASVMDALESAAGYLHRELRSRVTLKQVPELTFHLDTSIERGSRLSALIDQVSRPQR